MPTSAHAQASRPTGVTGCVHARRERSCPRSGTSVPAGRRPAGCVQWDERKMYRFPAVGDGVLIDAISRSIAPATGDKISQPTGLLYSTSRGSLPGNTHRSAGCVGMNPPRRGRIRLNGGSDRSSGGAGMIDPYGVCASVTPAVKATLRADVGIRPYGGSVYVSR